jgi:hypothetical protein
MKRMERARFVLRERLGKASYRQMRRDSRWRKYPW